MADLTLAQALALLPDNTLGEISAADLRNIVDALFGRTEGTYAIPALQFDTTPPAHTQVAGHVHWDTVDNTLGADVSTSGSLQVGFEEWINARNSTGSTILDGTPVRITSGGGQDVFIAPDNGLGFITGVATQNIPNNTNGRITSFGTVHDLNTSAFVDGAQLYSSSTGTLTTTPTSSFVGVVSASHASAGSLFVSPDSRTTSSGVTASRPTTLTTGYMYFDTTLGKPIWWNGSSWRDATGTAV